MPAISVLVPDPIGALVEARVASGEYASASDYVSELILRDQRLSVEDAK
jgi:Arc/MetJ-type ribon-helix-helix transcriptional regulator